MVVSKGRDGERDVLITVSTATAGQRPAGKPQNGEPSNEIETTAGLSVSRALLETAMLPAIGAERGGPGGRELLRPGRP